MKNKPHSIENSAFKEAKYAGISRVLVGLSGGADSIATTFLLKNIGLDVIALHCNFHLRGEESDSETLFVEKFCKFHEIPLKVIHFNVDDYIRKNPGASLEMACRDLRYNWFRLQLAETGYQRIVTGHNADDNIETFFLNMLRGAGTRGLRGMMADTGEIWRPLLSFHRNIILEYLELNNLEFRVDSSNLKSDFKRNFLRNEIFPLLRKEWKGFDKAMDKTISNLDSENRIVEQVIETALPLPGQPLSASSILNSAAPLLIIKRYIDPLGAFSSTPAEILAAIKAKKPHIARWRLKKGYVWLRNGNLFVEMSHGERST